MLSWYMRTKLRDIVARALCFAVFSDAMQKFHWGGVVELLSDADSDGRFCRLCFHVEAVDIISEVGVYSCCGNKLYVLRELGGKSRSASDSTESGDPCGIKLLICKS